MPNLFTKRNLIIAVLVLLLIAGGVIWYLLRQGAPPAGGRGGIGEFFSNLFPQGGERELTEEEQRRLEEAEQEGLLPPGTPAERGESFQLVKEVVSGATIIKGKLRYIEKSSGHVFEMGLDGQNKQRISNTTIPGIFEVVWSPQGNRAILKYLSGLPAQAGENLNIISAQFVGSSTQGIFLPPEIKDVTFSPKGDRIAYVLPSGGETLIVTATPENKNQTVRFRSSFSSWKIHWPEENNLYLLTAPSALLDGFLYRLNIASGNFQKILGPKLGLQIFLAGEKVINLADLNLQTFPEKCVKSRKEKDIIFCGTPTSFPVGIYPDDWSKGKVSFSDVFVKMNTINLESSVILPPESVDAINPFLSEDETLLFFINKIDGSLWRIKLE